MIKLKLDFFVVFLPIKFLKWESIKVPLELKFASSKELQKIKFVRVVNGNFENKSFEV